MIDRSNWDWETKEKAVPIDPWKENFSWVEEPYASPDGEQVAAIVNIDEGEFNVCVNGETWENPFEKIWYLRYAPDGRLTALVSKTSKSTISSLPRDISLHQFGAPRETRTPTPFGSGF